MADDRRVLRDGPFAAWFAEGVRVGRTIHLSGQIGVDDHGRVVAPGDLGAQARAAYARLAAVLARLDATLADVVEETIYVRDGEPATAELGPLYTARAEAFGGPPAAAHTLVRVAGLVFPEVLVEIRCVARAPRRKKGRGGTG